jgi:uncharacterized protein YutE (UPF0331/DUF86 family)
VRIEQYIQHLENEKARLARDALERPAGRDAFEYGRAVGMYAGLDIAKNLLLDLISEKERKDFDL